MIKRERDKKKLWVQVFGGDEAFQGIARKKISDFFRWNPLYATM